MKPAHSLPASFFVLACAASLFAATPVTAQMALYVANSTSGDITMITADGTASTFVSGLLSASNLGFDASGNLYVGLTVASGTGGSISRVTPSGVISTFASYPNVNEPVGLAFDANGNLYSSDYAEGGATQGTTIRKITPGGVVSTFVTGLNDPSGLAFDAHGNLYVANSGANSIVEVAPDGTESIFASGLNFPYALAFDAAGNLYVSNYGSGTGITVSKYTPDGVGSTFATGLAGPTGLAFDQSGNLYVANSDTFGGGTVTKITPDGTQSLFATGLKNPTGLIFGPIPSAAPTITSAASATAFAGQAFRYQVTATNSPSAFGASGLPQGLGINGVTGLISGTPTKDGAYTVTLSATAGSATSSATLNLRVGSSFFGNETPLSSGVYYLTLPNGNGFGYYSYLTDPNYVYHFDLGYEYIFDAADGNNGIYLYDFSSQNFFYTSTAFSFPYLYDFSLNSVVYYYPDPSNAGHYNTNGIRYFYVFRTGQIISK